MNSIKQFLIRTAEGYLAKNDPEKHNPFKTAITGNMTSSHKYAARDAPTPQQQNYQVAEILERISQDKVATVQELKEAMSSGQARLQNQNLRISDEIVSLDDLEAIYKRFGIIFKAVNTRVKKIWKVAPRVEPAIPDDAQAEADAKECEDFLVSSRLNKGKKPKLLTTNSVIFGNGWLEIIYDPVTGKPIDTEAIHPATMDFRRKGDGSIELVDDADSVYAGLPVAYQQKVGQATKDFYREGWGKETDGEWKQILQLTFYSVGDEFLGISMLEPMYKTAEQYMKILEGRGEAAYRSAWQRTFIDYGVEGNVNSCTPEAKKQAEEVAKDLVQGDIIVKPWFLKVDAIQPDLSNFDKLDDGYVNILAATSGLPKFNLMGVSKETSFATSKSQRADFADEIKSDQESIAECFELQLFARILDIDITKPEERKRIPRLVFPDPNEDADTDKIDNILKLYNPGVGLAPIVTIEEARRMVQEVVDIPEVDLSTLDKPKTREERPPPAPTPVPNTTTPEPRTVASETMTTNMKGHKHRVVIDSKGSGIAE